MYECVHMYVCVAVLCLQSLHSALGWTGRSVMEVTALGKKLFLRLVQVFIDLNHLLDGSDSLNGWGVWCL